MSNREQFEAWITEADIGALEFGRDGECYVDWDTQVAWRGWKGARSSALEEAAKICDESAAAWDETAKGNYDGTYDSKADAARECAAEIRKLAKETNNG